MTDPRAAVIDEAISTERLNLVVLRAETLRALLRGDRQGASRAQGIALPDEFPCAPDDLFLKLQLQRVEAHPESRGWCARATVRREDGEVVGHCGFHGPPAVIGRAEIGYTVFAAHRRRGYATEAAKALTDWAREQGEHAVFASVAPDNRPSLAVVRKLGFRQTGIQIDDVDGEELVFELTVLPSPSR